MIGFAGLSHLGIVSSIATAAKGFEVVAYDPDASLCAALGQGRLPVSEPGLPDLLAANRTRIRFSADPAELGRCQVIYLSKDVPTDQDNRSDLTAFDPLVKQMVQWAAPGAALVVLCQVPPGFTRRLAGRLPDSARTKGLQLLYQVETLIFGRAVERALYPERYIVGCREPQAPLPPAYAELLGAFGCPVLPMRYESAELAKISINFCLVASVSVANTLAELCEAIGADWSEIIPTLKLDKRIGPHSYLAPGLGIAGGNLERDLATVRGLAQEWGTDAGVVEAWLANSRHRRDWVLRTIHGQVIPRCPRPTVAVWGLAYKQDTASTKNSPALALLESIRPFKVRAYDPQVVLRGDDFPHVEQTASALEACRGADVLAVMTPWKEFESVNPVDVAAAMNGRVVIDPYGVLPGQQCRERGLSYFKLGTPPESLEAVA
jgi:UDPglucose 6-dehydrogenase